MVPVEPTRLTGVDLFNSPLETGIRAVVILNAAYPMMFDLLHLTWFDHLVVHTADINGPPSLHPDLPHRTGELLVRRRIIEGGLNLMRRLNLIDMIADARGIFYQATDDSYALVERMKTQYAEDLKIRAQWLAENVCPLPEEQLRRMLADRIGEWRAEFGTSGIRSAEAL
jgi:hypothetical protein